MKRLKNKSAVITGGAGDIGRSIAKLFLNEGAAVLLVDRDEQALAEACIAIGGQDLDTCVADITTETGVSEYTQTAVDRFGRMDVLILNAGLVGPMATIVDYPVDAFDQLMAVNVRGAWLGLKYAIPIMTRGGSIVLAASISGVRAAAQMSAYAVSKHAVVGLTRTAAIECAGAGIRINAVAPGPVESRMMRAVETGQNTEAPADAHTFIECRIPLGRYGRPEDVARMMLFLASDDSAFCTGGVYLTDGGLTAK